jgi:type VII secretion-associated serine protease mycosin
MTRRFLTAIAVALTGTSVTLCGVPALADQLRDKQWHLHYLKVAQAQRISKGNGVTVAVIDSGVSNHPDLSGNLLEGTDFVKRGGNGHIDLTGHGTSMAGLIAAHGKNGTGALGIAPEARILPIRVLGSGTNKVNYGPALQYAISHNAKIINISVGGSLSSETIEALEAAKKSDVVIVGAAGNKPRDSGVTSPAFYEGIVAVGAVDRSGKKSSISVTGPEIDIAAPGEDMTSTTDKGLYTFGQRGTSDAAAIVSGAAALLRSKYPNMTADEVVERLESTATDKGPPGVDDEYGHGIVNIVAALAAPTPTKPSASPPPPPATTPHPTASPDTKPATATTARIITGVALLLLLGGLLSYLLLRRRSSGNR